MKPQKEVKISNWASHMTTGVSVTLALLTLGLISMIWIAATGETRRMLEKIEISVVMADDIGDNRAMAICEALGKQPFARNVRYISREQAHENWKVATGEDLEQVFGVNPLSPEVSFTVAGEYTTPRKIIGIRKGLMSIKGVMEVGSPDSGLIESMTSNIKKFTVAFSVLAAIMLVISFVLISNTVRLTIYSKRFTIHTMQLVGATNGFIRKPFVMVNAMVGAISGIVAGGLLSGLLVVSDKIGLGEISTTISWHWMIVVDIGLVASGILICGVAAALATTRHLRQDYEELFK